MKLSNNIHILNKLENAPGVGFKALPDEKEKPEEKFSAKNLNDSPNAYYNKIGVNKVSNPLKKNTSKHDLAHYEGCLVGGAIGDALGAPIEFATIEDIKKKYGDKGVSYLKKKDNVYKFTDDTQMTIFLADGLTKSYLQNPSLKDEPDYNVIYDSYLNWYATQQRNSRIPQNNGILSESQLYSRRAPGNTCISSLASGQKGSVEDPINDSAGNGAAMRVAPIGLLYHQDPKLAFKIAVKDAAMTHGHEGGYLSAGFHSALIASIINGKSLPKAIEASMDILKTYKKHEHLTGLLNKAIKLSESETPQEEALPTLGRGTRGDEAMAIAIYSALKNPDSYKNAVFTAINHAGDSDTTGAITGNIMGAYLGTDAMPRAWKENIELSHVIKRLSENLFINDSELKYNKISKKEDSKILERRADDSFKIEQHSISFFKEDLVKMSKMDIKEKLEYIKNLKESGRYFSV